MAELKPCPAGHTDVGSYELGFFNWQVACYRPSGRGSSRCAWTLRGPDRASTEAAWNAMHPGRDAPVRVEMPSLYSIKDAMSQAQSGAWDAEPREVLSLFVRILSAHGIEVADPAEPPASPRSGAPTAAPERVPVVTEAIRDALKLIDSPYTGKLYTELTTDELRHDAIMRRCIMDLEAADAGEFVAVRREDLSMMKLRILELESEWEAEQLRVSKLEAALAAKEKHGQPTSQDQRIS